MEFLLNIISKDWFIYLEIFLSFIYIWLYGIKDNLNEARKSKGVVNDGHTSFRNKNLKWKSNMFHYFEIIIWSIIMSLLLAFCMNTKQRNFENGMQVVMFYGLYLFILEMTVCKKYKQTEVLNTDDEKLFAIIINIFNRLKEKQIEKVVKREYFLLNENTKTRIKKYKLKDNEKLGAFIYSLMGNSLLKVLEINKSEAATEEVRLHIKEIGELFIVEEYSECYSELKVLFNKTFLKLEVNSCTLKEILDEFEELYTEEDLNSRKKAITKKIGKKSSSNKRSKRKVADLNEYVSGL